MKNDIPLSERMIRGHIGKRFVIKHYSSGRVVKTKYPDMVGIVPSQKQRACRVRFAQAVAYAKEILADAEQKEKLINRYRTRSSQRASRQAY